MAKQYSPKVKAKIIAWVKQYDEKNGRGGMAHAVKKFKVTFLTLRKWLNKIGTPKTAAKKIVKAKSRKPGKASKNVQTRQDSKNLVYLRNKVKIGLAVIAKLENEIASREQAIKKEKAELLSLIA